MPRTAIPRSPIIVEQYGIPRAVRGDRAVRLTETQADMLWTLNEQHGLAVKWPTFLVKVFGRQGHHLSPAAVSDDLTVLRQELSPLGATIEIGNTGPRLVVAFQRGA